MVRPQLVMSPLSRRYREGSISANLSPGFPPFPPSGNALDKSGTLTSCDVAGVGDGEGAGATLAVWLATTVDAAESVVADVAAGT